MVAHAHTLVIVPYRNRASQLALFKQNAWPLISSWLGEGARLLVVEQVSSKLFNRGKLLNIGVKHALSTETNVIFHDVDVYPTKHAKHLYQQDVPQGMICGIFNSPYVTLGGVIKLRIDDMYKMNGFGNEFWGWGSEDRDLYNRAMHCGFGITFGVIAGTQEAGRVFHQHDTVQDRVRSGHSKKQHNMVYQGWTRLSETDRLNYMLRDGMSTCLFVKEKDGDTHIVVSV